MIAPGSISGHFDLKVYDAYTGKLTNSRSFPNLITNQGLIAYCGGGNIGDFVYDIYACVGNGTSTPTPEDTTLASHLKNSNKVSSGTWKSLIAPTAPDWISGVSCTVRFNAGTFDGTTITEIGITNGKSNNPVWCRALILDEQGQPSAIVVLANEYLDVTYTLYYHPKLDDTEFQFQMDGVTYNCIARTAFVSSQAFYLNYPLMGPYFSFGAVYNTQTLGDVTGEPVYSSGGRITLNIPPSSVAYSSETPYTFRRKFNLALSQGNFDGGIGAALVRSTTINGMNPQTQISFTPKLPKDANTEMSFTLARTMARWTP